VKTENVLEHKMHAEWVEVKKTAAQRIVKAKKQGRRIVAADTTAVRVLEAVLAKFALEPKAENLSGWVDIFIYPGYEFKIVDAMITNFHLPKSTLLMLVSAFVGPEKTKKVYEQAVKDKYRFFSYGDAMFIL